MNAQDGELSSFKRATGPPERCAGRLKYVEAPMQTMSTKRSDASTYLRQKYAKGSTISFHLRTRQIKAVRASLTL